METLLSVRAALVWVLLGLIAAAILEPKKTAGLRQLFYVVLGPIGLVHLVAPRQNEHRYCPACDERITVHLNTCPHCGHDDSRGEASSFGPDGSEGSDMVALG